MSSDNRVQRRLRLMNWWDVFDSFSIAEPAKPTPTEIEHLRMLAKQYLPISLRGVRSWIPADHKITKYNA